MLGSLALVMLSPPAAPDRGPLVGEPLPAFEAPDQRGQPRSFADLRGPKGLVLVFFRSADWRPYCKGQLVELESQRVALERRGLGLAALSYDSVGLLEEFASRRGIGFPLLSDPRSEIIQRFGLLNPAYPAADPAHGVPHPVTFVTDAQGVVRAKYAEEHYSDRQTAASLLVYVGEPPPGRGEEVQAEHFRLRAGISNEVAAPGQRLTLVLEIEMEDGHHVYAPGAEGYRVLALSVDPQPLVRLAPARFPDPRSYYFAPLKETVPVFEGRFRLLQDVTLVPNQPMQPLLAQPDPTLRLTGRLAYQVCSATICYPPGSLPVAWSIRVRAPDRERAPEELRRRPSR